MKATKAGDEVLILMSVDEAMAMLEAMASHLGLSDEEVTLAREELLG